MGKMEMNQQQPELLTYQQVWLDRRAKDYIYLCKWSDGAETREHALPWGRMPNAVQVGPNGPVTLDEALASLNAALLTPYGRTADEPAH
jgi:hypothetical protein